MSAPASHENTADRSSAGVAWLGGAQVNAVFELEEAALPIGVNVIRDRGAAQTNGMAQDLEKRLSEAFKFDSSEAACGPARADTGTKETLVSIDVTYSGEEGLIE